MGKSVEIVVDKESSAVHVLGLACSKIVLDCSGDIDFTDLVSTLTRNLGTEEAIEIKAPDKDDDPRMELVLTTIKSILDKYSESIEIIKGNEDEMQIENDS